MILYRKCNLEKQNVSGKFSYNNRTAYVIDIIKNCNVLKKYYLTQPLQQIKDLTTQYQFLVRKRLNNQIVI